MDSESLVAYVNGEYVPRAHAKISIFDVGFLRGDAVFDTTSAWNGSVSGALTTLPSVSTSPSARSARWM